MLHGGSLSSTDSAFNAYTCTITVSKKISKLLNIILQKQSNLRGTLQMTTETWTQSSQQMPFSVPPLTITWQGCSGAAGGGVGWAVDNSPLPGLPLDSSAWYKALTERAQHPGLTAHPTHTFRELTVSTREVATVPGTWQSTAGLLLSPARGSALLDVLPGHCRSRTQLPRHEGLSACFLLCRHAAHEAGGQALREALGSHRLHTAGTQTQATGDDSSDLTSVWALLSHAHFLDGQHTSPAPSSMG